MTTLSVFLFPIIFLYLFFLTPNSTDTVQSDIEYFILIYIYIYIYILNNDRYFIAKLILLYNIFLMKFDRNDYNLSTIIYNNYCLFFSKPSIFMFISIINKIKIWIACLSGTCLLN